VLQCLFSRWRAPVMALSCAVLAAGCGGGSDAETAPSQPPMAAPPLRAATLPNAAAADLLMNFGESGYGQFFPSHQPTQTSYPPFQFRYYPDTHTYLGVVVQASDQYTAGGVYVMGGAFGNSPQQVGLLGQFVFAWDTPGANWDQTPWQ